MATTVTADNSTVEVTVIDEVVHVNVCEDVVEVVTAITGPPGPMGETAWSDLGYVHDQAVATQVWTIEHNLHFIPNITVVDSAGTVVEGDYDYPDENTVVLTFSGAFAGKAYLS